MMLFLLSERLDPIVGCRYDPRRRRFDANRQSES